jgi:4-amino-4-deoxy-L-arabinose transferase-like glycosyltransferase
MRSAPASLADYRDKACRALAFALWIAFLILCAGTSVSTGLSYFDDAEMALVAQSLAHGTGYSTSPEADITEMTQFQPGISAGPTLILPCAIFLKLFGTKEAVPGLTALLIWASLLTCLLLRISRHVSGSSFLLGVAFFLLLVLATFVWQFGAWYAFLGEAAAAALLLFGHWILAMERLSSRWLFLSGLCLGLAVQTKYLATFGTIGAGVILFLRWQYARDEAKLSLGKVAIWLIGCLAPTAAFELWKLIELGSYSYTANWAAFLTAAKGQGFASGNHPALYPLRERVSILQEYFLINVPAFVLFLFAGLCLGMTRIRRNWTWLFLGLLVSFLSLALYWTFFSIGWPRYLVIAMALVCFALSVPVFGFLKFRHALLFLPLSVAVFSGGMRRIPATITRAADHGLFKATAERHARKKIVVAIRGLREQGPLVVGTVNRAESHAVEFDLNKEVKFQRVDSQGNLPGKKIVLINRLLGGPNHHAYIEDALHGPISSVILSDGPYELLRVDGAP